MAESIEYSSIVKFINEDIIQGKLAVQAGGMEPVATGDVTAELKDTARNLGAETDSLTFQTGVEAVKSLITSVYQRAGEYPGAIAILAFGLTATATVYMKGDTENAKYILGATIIAFAFSGAGRDILDALISWAKPEEKRSATPERFSTGSKIDLRPGKSMTGANELGGGAAAAQQIVDLVKNNLKLVLAAVGGVAILAYYANVDRNLSFSQNMANILGSKKSSGPVSYFFNPSTGSIDVTGSANKTVVLSSSKHFGTGKIEMKIAGSDVTYTINGAKLEHPSYIEGKPVHTALVMAYIIKDRSSHMPVTAVGKADSNYLYSIEDDGSIRLFDNKGGVKGEEIASINMAIRQQLEGNEKESTETRNKVCKKLFGVNVDKNVCASHFYNILGKSALGMLNNMSGPVQSDDVVQALVTAEAHIQYEILKNLDWKMKVSNGNKEMVTVDQWLERLGQDSRPEMKKLVAEYIKYFSTNDRVKSVLDRMVANLNNNTRLLDEKYKEAVSTPQPAIRRKRARLSAAQVANLRSQVLTDNVTLNSPFPVPGRPGVFLSNYTSPFQMGGAANTYENNFANIKQALAAFNQKLSSDTEAKINSKIKEINELDARLSDIHRKINEYTTVLRTEKYPTNISRTVTLSDVENLINQYKSGTQEQTKQVVTLSTAFGKIKMLLEKADANVKPSGKNYMFDL